jgi:hypothetical protein
MSIKSDEQLLLAHEQLLRLQSALLSLRRDMADRNQFGYRLMAEGPLDEIRRIRAEVAEYTGESLLEAEEVDLRLRIIGPQVKWRDVPVSVLASFLRNFRNGVRSLSNCTVKEMSTYAPKIDVDRASDFAVVDFQPGSLDIGLRLPELISHQVDLFDSERKTPIQAAVQDYLMIADWVGSNESIDELEKIFPDTGKRRVALKAMKPMIPRDNQVVEALELYGQVLRKIGRIRITSLGLPRVVEAYKSSVSDKEVAYEGEIREIDLDKFTFSLRNISGGIQDVACSYPKEMAMEAHASLGKRVTAVGIRSTQLDGLGLGKVSISEILPLEDAGR